GPATRWALPWPPRCSGCWPRSASATCSSGRPGLKRPRTLSGPTTCGGAARRIDWVAALTRSQIMKRYLFLIVIAAATLVAGCGSQGNRGASSPAPAPNVVAELTNQTEVYTCPQCGMDYDGPGQCSMCKVDLVRTRIDYICPADHKAVERAGKCPRCAANAV